MKNCTIYNTMDIIGKRWTLCILLELYKGDNNEKQFNELKGMLEGITPKMLSTRLKELEEQGIVNKSVDSTTLPARSFYSLTESGMDFIRIIQDIKQWALAWQIDNPECGMTECKYCGIISK
ncbi:DNA-binding HxlR family transcriptional regulator [Methanohalophilus levihalophilus]|uniref:winged helix-turn-helix transcriptional regulator n=1 Tax=Methanohalophilus levihalophilus TaxID=1431282 RepID=UPI001AE4F7D8|nr:helix-turn-helix domain-containing protein [Methanohalophilus levihalophilus]MBP2031018.1 DNA-binding HxlR family transcriptional regulator [Methanohalophilus levihalophilus]